MPVNDELGKRMKEYYEQIPKTKLMRRTPVAIRLDGRAFHTFTKGFQKPFDEVLVKSMQETTKYLCENIQGCVLGYTQSDEITLILVDYKNLNTAAWFDYEVQKMCSIAASMATMKFNRVFEEKVNEYSITGKGTQVNWYRTAIHRGAMFDARVFNVPKEEVTNLIYWRQLDATRNSIQMVGQAIFSHNELQYKSCNDIQNMLLTQKDINWNDFPTRWKRGVACRRFPGPITNISYEINPEWGEPYTKQIACRRHEWKIDWDMPILKGENRSYIEELVFVGEE